MRSSNPDTKYHNKAEEYRQEIADFRKGTRPLYEKPTDKKVIVVVEEKGLGVIRNKETNEFLGVVNADIIDFLNNFYIHTKKCKDGYRLFVHNAYWGTRVPLSHVVMIYYTQEHYDPTGKHIHHALHVSVNLIEFLEVKSNREKHPPERKDFPTTEEDVNKFLDDILKKKLEIDK